jgi:hypothetical protein
MLRCLLAPLTDSTHAIHHFASQVFVWAAMNMAIMLISVICDAIHQLEADRPLLSWLLPTWVKIVRHARAFEEQHAQSDVVSGETASLVDTVKKRFDTHYNSSWAAAYLVDPMFAEEGTQGWYLFKGRELLGAAKLDDALACLQDLAGAGNADAVRQEFTRLKLSPLPADMAKDLPTLVQRSEGEGGSVYVATAEMRRGWWDVHSTHFPLIADAAIRLLSFHVTSCATERNWSVWGRLCTKTTNRRLLERAAKLVTIMTSGESAAVQADEDEELMALLSKES